MNVMIPGQISHDDDVSAEKNPSKPEDAVRSLEGRRILVVFNPRSGHGDSGLPDFVQSAGSETFTSTGVTVTI
ncbi:hypothetical protein CTI14_40750 [Methylobacterium radiotolerans]|nr:hypothetical protein CTI14_40750 [Methylobacterium radiotolerans]